MKIISKVPDNTVKIIEAPLHPYFIHSPFAVLLDNNYIKYNGIVFYNRDWIYEEISLDEYNDLLKNGSTITCKY